MHRHTIRILAAAALALASAQVPAGAQSPYGQSDRYHDHLWTPTNGGFAAGVANVPGVSPGGAAGSSYSNVVTYPTGVPDQPQQPPATVTPTPNPPAPTGRWVGQLSGYYNSNGYAVYVQTVVCDTVCSTPKPATTVYGTQYSDNFYCQTSDGHGSSAGFPPGGSRGFYTFPQCYLGYSF